MTDKSSQDVKDLSWIKAFIIAGVIVVIGLILGWVFLR